MRTFIVNSWSPQISPSHSELAISPAEALEVIRVVTGAPVAASSTGEPEGSDVGVPTGHSAMELLKAEQLLGSVVTFCAKVDSMLGGGVSLGKVTEFCGAPGVGKTQLWCVCLCNYFDCVQFLPSLSALPSMQLAVDVSIPEVFGGLEGEAVYIGV